MGKIQLIMGAVILLLAAATVTEFERAGKFKLAAETAQKENAGLLEAIKSKDDVLDRYEVEAKAAQKLASDQKAALDRAAENAGDLALELAKTRHELDLKEEADHAIPECQKLLDTDLAVCPNISHSLLDRASRSLQGSSARSERASETGNQPTSASGLSAGDRTP